MLDRSRRFLLLASLVAVPFAMCSAHAATPERVLIQVSCKCEDAGGKAYLQALHLQLSASGKFQEVDATEAKSETVIRLDIVSSPLAPEAAGSPPRTEIAIIGKHNGAVMQQSLETCNRIPLQACVQYMLDALGSI